MPNSIERRPVNPDPIIETGLRALISTRVTQFPYYDQLLGKPVWKNRKILDFGGNQGCFLRSARDKLNHDDYWCMDIARPALDQGRRQFPQAHFIHYNRYHSEYNPSGLRYAPVPDCGLKFDLSCPFPSLPIYTAKNSSSLSDNCAAC